ncbi:Uncharacterized protein APZ42_002078, partial [Daphnia magna]
GDLGAGLGLLGNGAGLAVAALLDRLGGGLVPDPLGAAVGEGFVLAEGLVDPLAVVAAGADAEVRMDFEVGAGFEGLDLGLAGGEDGEGRGLDPAGGGDVEAAVAGAEAGQGAGGIEADQPVGLGAALRGIGQRAHFLVGAELFPGLDDRLVGHRLHP